MRRVLALLELAREGSFSRAKVMEFLTETELPRATVEQYDRVRTSEWETYTREAGIVEGIEQWRERLARLANEKRERAKDERFTWLADVPARIETLVRFAEDFHAALAERAEEATWGEHLAFLRSLVERYAAGTRFEQPLVNSAFTLAVVTGLTVPDTSENAAANLEWTDIKLPKPVFEGDTLHAESEILEVRESASNPSVGIVSMRCRGINQRGEVVIEFRRTFMAYRRGAPEVAHRFPHTDAEWTV